MVHRKVWGKKAAPFFGRRGKVLEELGKLFFGQICKLYWVGKQQKRCVLVFLRRRHVVGS